MCKATLKADSTLLKFTMEKFKSPPTLLAHCIKVLRIHSDSSGKVRVKSVPNFPPLSIQDFSYQSCLACEIENVDFCRKIRIPLNLVFHKSSTLFKATTKDSHNSLLGSRFRSSLGISMMQESDHNNGFATNAPCLLRLKNVGWLK